MSILQRLGRGSVRVHSRGYFAERVIQRAAGGCEAAAQPLNSPQSPSAETRNGNKHAAGLVKNFARWNK